MGFDLSDLQPKERASFALRALYEAAGCRKYHMGRFEEYGLYQENRSFLSSEQVITFTDLDGRLLALKPDVTLSIAKTAQPAPGETLKYYYHENVYRPSAESHTFKEIAQMGLEMLGAVGEAQVQQAVGLAAKSLEQLGAAWVLELSHMGYLFGLLDALAVPETARPALLDLLREKNAHELRAAAKAAGLDDAGADTLCALLTLCGGCEETLARAEAFCKNDRMRAAAAELRALTRSLSAGGGSIRLDLSLAGEMEYYNGLVFQGYLQGLPRPLLKGGRYDLLMQKFTPGGSFIGFAVYLDELDRLSAPLPPVQQQKTDRVMLNVALPKGRLGDKVYGLLDRIGYGGYLKLASNWPGFIDEIQNVVGEFRQIHENMQDTKSYVAPFKVAILNCWGGLRKWMSNQVHHSIYHRETYSAEGVLECLSGMPFDVEFIDFDDIRNGIPEGIGVIINVGDAYTAFSGAENWIDEKVVTAIRKFVDEGGGFIGVGEPTAYQHQGRYFQLSDVMGVDREMGFSLSTDKYNTCDPHHFILEDIDGKIDFGEGTSRIYAQGKHYQILAQDGEYSQLVVNEYGKGHSVYFAGLPYSPQNCRILLRAIYYAAGMPEEMKHYYVTNVDTEVTVFPETKRIAVINNADAEEKTDLYIKGHLIDSLTLAPREMRWVDDAE